MYDFYPPMHAYLIPLLSLSWAKRFFITAGVIAVLISGWYGFIFTQLYSAYNHQIIMLETTQTAHANLPSLKNQIVCLEQSIAEKQQHPNMVSSDHQFTAALLSLCCKHQLTVNEYGNQTRSMPGTIKTHGCFKDQSTLLQQIHETLPFGLSMCRMERFDDDTVAMTLSFNVTR